MLTACELTHDERAVLRSALDAPVMDRGPAVLGLCLRLGGRRLMQRAGAAAAATGGHGSPPACVLTREAWAVLKAEPLYKPVRQAG